MKSNVFNAALEVKACMAQVENDLIEEVPIMITIKHFKKLERALLALGAEIGEVPRELVDRGRNLSNERRR